MKPLRPAFRVAASSNKPQGIRAFALSVLCHAAVDWSRAVVRTDAREGIRRQLKCAFYPDASSTREKRFSPRRKSMKTVLWKGYLHLLVFCGPLDLRSYRRGQMPRGNRGTRKRSTTVNASVRIFPRLAVDSYRRAVTARQVILALALFSFSARWISPILLHPI